MFLTYEEFLGYGGDATVTAAQFGTMEHRAEAYLNLTTHNRVKDETPVRESVKLCAFYLTQLEFGYAKADAANSAGNGVSSQSNDGVSITYMSHTDTEKARCNERKAYACEYLADEVKDGVPLLYAGGGIR